MVNLKFLCHYDGKIYPANFGDFSHAFHIETNAHIDDITMMQFVGQVDRKGRDVYEDFIVRDRGGNRYLVMYVEYMGAFMLSLLYDKDGKAVYQFINLSDAPYFEIIGDRHTTPELMEADYDTP